MGSHRQHTRDTPWLEKCSKIPTTFSKLPKRLQPRNMSTRIPTLLEPYLALPPEASLVLLTSVLGASSNWLVLRFLHSALIGSEVSSSSVVSEDEPKVLFVSFMRDLAFWKENARRLVGHNVSLLSSLSSEAVLKEYC